MFQSPKNEEITLPHEFTFVCYFIGAILLKKSCQKQVVGKKMKREMAIQRGCLQKGCSNLLHTMRVIQISGTSNQLYTSRRKANGGMQIVYFRSQNEFLKYVEKFVCILTLVLLQILKHTQAKISQRMSIFIQTGHL